MMGADIDELLMGLQPSGFGTKKTKGSAGKKKIMISEAEHTITILHFADIRYGWKGPQGLYEAAHKKAWQALINTFRDNAIADINNPQYVVICGDIAYSGIKQEYEQCNEEFICPLLETLGISRDHLLTCPGNHDSDITLDNGDGYIPEKGIPITGSKRRHLTKGRFESLSEKFHNYSSSFFDSTGLKTLVYNRRFEDITVLSLNSAWYSSYHEKGDGNLLIGKESCKDEVELLHEEFYEKSRKTVAIIHHPLRFDKRGFGWFHMEENEPNILTMQESFIQHVEDSAYIVLTGSPVFEQNVIPDPHGKCIVSCGITRGDKTSKGEYSYNAALIEIHDTIITVKIIKYDLMEGGEYWKLKADNFKFYQDSPIKMKREAELLEEQIEYVINDPEATIIRLRKLWSLVRGNRNVSESSKNKLYEKLYQQYKQNAPDDDIDNASERESRKK